MSDRVPLMSLQEALDHGFELVKSYIDNENAGLRKELAELKSRPEMKYAGVWSGTKVYTIGSFVTDDGSLWHCCDACVGARPGSSDAWQLAVKRGRDAKGSR